MQFKKMKLKISTPALRLIDLLTIDIVESSQCIFGDMFLVKTVL